MRQQGQVAPSPTRANKKRGTREARLKKVRQKVRRSNKDAKSTFKKETSIFIPREKDQKGIQKTGPMLLEGAVRPVKLAGGRRNTAKKKDTAQTSAA